MMVISKPEQQSCYDGTVESIAPTWLLPLLKMRFFGTCKVHADSSKNECNQYCLDCMDNALCPACIQSNHKNHHVIQIRRSSYHDVIRVSEVQKVLDLTGIQSYIINSARVVFINGRPQLRQGKGVTNNCEICDRSLLDSFRFCSLGCKMDGIKKYHPDMTFLLSPGSGNQTYSNSHAIKSSEHEPKRDLNKQLHAINHIRPNYVANYTNFKRPRSTHRSVGSAENSMSSDEINTLSNSSSKIIKNGDQENISKEIDLQQQFIRTAIDKLRMNNNNYSELIPNLTVINQMQLLISNMNHNSSNGNSNQSAGLTKISPLLLQDHCLISNNQEITQNHYANHNFNYQNNSAFSPPTPPPIIRRSPNRRKGIPHRAPMAS